MSLLNRSVIAGLVLFLVLMVTVMAQAAAVPLKITEMAVTTKMVKGNPIDSVRRISPASVSALYCFTRITAVEAADTTIKHVWYRNEEKVAEYELPVKGLRWRTFSKKTVDREAGGDWRVEAIDSDGKVLKVVKFRMN
jgi:hypothetical protein